VFNATVVPSPTLGYLTLWPYGGTQPGVSTLNAYDGFVASSMAIVRTPMAQQTRLLVLLARDIRT
jgi:hypothetical protein